MGEALYNIFFETENQLEKYWTYTFLLAWDWRRIKKLVLKLHHLKLAVRLVLGGMNPDKCHYVVMIVKNSARGDSAFLLKWVGQIG